VGVGPTKPKPIHHNTGDKGREGKTIADLTKTNANTP